MENRALKQYNDFSDRSNTIESIVSDDSNAAEDSSANSDRYDSDFVDDDEAVSSTGKNKGIFQSPLEKAFRDAERAERSSERRYGRSRRSPPRQEIEPQESSDDSSNSSVGDDKSDQSNYWHEETKTSSTSPRPAKCKPQQQESEYESADENAYVGKLFCSVCRKIFPNDSFSAVQQRHPDSSSRYCLRHTGTSGFGRSYVKPSKPVTARKLTLAPNHAHCDTPTESDDDSSHDSDLIAVSAERSTISRHGANSSAPVRSSTRAASAAKHNQRASTCSDSAIKSAENQSSLRNAYQTRARLTETNENAALTTSANAYHSVNSKVTESKARDRLTRRRVVCSSDEDSPAPPSSSRGKTANGNGSSVAKHKLSKKPRRAQDSDDEWEQIDGRSSGNGGNVNNNGSGKSSKNGNVESGSKIIREFEDDLVEVRPPAKPVELIVIDD